MDEAQLLRFVEQYGYGIMLVLMILEGPIVTILGAFLSSIGVFHVGVVFILSVTGDMVGDVILYYAGRFWGMRFVRGFGKYIGITETFVEKVRAYFLRHGGKTVFAVKSTTGLCWATFFTAGMIRMQIQTFLLYSFLGGIVWSALLVSTGFFFGKAYFIIDHYIRWAGWIIATMAVGSVFAFMQYKKRKSKTFLQN